jgi:hypothetical protein
MAGSRSLGREGGMNTTLTLIDLAGSIALLLWGVHMVQSGIQRAFGPHQARPEPAWAATREWCGLMGSSLPGVSVASSAMANTTLRTREHNRTAFPLAASSS